MMYGPAGGPSSTGAARGGALPLLHPSRAESSRAGNRVQDRGAPGALLDGRLRWRLPSGARPRPGATRPEGVRPSGTGHLHRGKRQRDATPVRDRPVLGRDPGRTTRHRGARARLRRLAGEARGEQELGIAAAQELGKQRDIDAVFAGHLKVTNPQAGGGLAGLVSPHLDATVRLDLTVRLLSTRSGATLWRSSAGATDKVGHVALVD